MAGFRTFATGEVLTAANVNNFLMGQSVMRFADADARTAALGADVVEGMLTYNLATDQLEVFDGSAFVVAAPEPPAGIGSNVVNVVKSGTFTTSSSTYVDVTGLTVTITPTSATSKILVVAQVSGQGPGTGGNSQRVGFAIFRDAVNIAAGTGSDDFTGQLGIRDIGSSDNQMNASASVLDSPATTSPTVYKCMVKSLAGTMRINSDAGGVSNTVSTITAIEVAA